MPSLKELRARGAHYELEFARKLAERGLIYTLNQQDKSSSAVYYSVIDQEIVARPLPDVTVFSHPGFHAEVKDKRPTDLHNWIGLERYRLRSMLSLECKSKQPVLYVIHISDTDEWFAISTKKFLQSIKRIQEGPSLVNGLTVDVETCYVPLEKFTPLEQVLDYLVQKGKK